MQGVLMVAQPPGGHDPAGGGIVFGMPAALGARAGAVARVRRRPPGNGGQPAPHARIVVAVIRRRRQHQHGGGAAAERAGTTQTRPEIEIAIDR